MWFSSFFWVGLLSTPTPTTPIVGIAFITLYAIREEVDGEDYKGMNAPALGRSKETGHD